MHIRRLTLQRYRNYGELEMEFPGSLNIFVGDNAQGKTNLMESIYLLAMSRSFRTTRDVELIRWDSDISKVRAEVERYSGMTTIEAELSRTSRKRFRVNGQELGRIADLLGYLNVVAFTPDDLQMVKGSPGQRRQFLDIEICQVSRVYREDLARYNQVLTQRNRLLKDIAEKRMGKGTLEVWDEQLVYYGTRVIMKRAEAVRQLAHWGHQMHQAISSGGENLHIVYQPFFLLGESQVSEFTSCQDRTEIERLFIEAMDQVRSDEFRRGVTLVGPQRDDIIFLVNDMEARIYGSQGQQRSVVLSCKLAELEFMNSVTGQYPVLLLDDVMSELDESRRSFLMKTVLERVQTFLTTTSFDGVHTEIIEQADVFSIHNGRVERRPPTSAG